MEAGTRLAQIVLQISEPGGMLAADVRGREGQVLLVRLIWSGELQRDRGTPGCWQQRCEGVRGF